MLIDKGGYQTQVENEISDANDFGVSLTERIKRRKRAAQPPEVNNSNNIDESNYLF